MEAILTLDRVTRGFTGPAGPVRVLAGASLTLKAGEVATLQGPSGSGKTTLLLAAGGLLAPESGTVTLGGRDLYAMGPEERAAYRARTVGFVFQQFHLIPYLSVRDNIKAAALAARAPDSDRRAREWAERFGLGHRLDHVPAGLSTGEQQRTALARALLNRPALVLADEPTGNLDAENGERILTALADYAKEGGSVLLVTHDPAALNVAGRALRLRNGIIDA